MEKNIPYHLIASQLDGSIDTVDKTELDAWLAESIENQATFEKYKNVWERTGQISTEFSPDAFAALNKVHAKLQGVPSARTIALQQNYPLFLKIAAGIAIVIISGYMYYSLRTPSMVIAETSKNGKTELIIADGSKIVLNHNSKLSYPDFFKGKTRKVKLEGEAFFEVAKDSLHPFIIEANGTQTEVLGTKFNLRSYSIDSFVIINLTEGKVSFTNLGNNQHVLLLAGERAIIDKRNNSIQKQAQESKNFESWKSGILIFENSPLTLVAKELSEYYGRQIAIGDTTIINLRLNGKFENQSFREVVKTVEEAMNIEFHEQGKTIEITSK